MNDIRFLKSRNTVTDTVKEICGMAVNDWWWAFFSFLPGVACVIIPACIWSLFNHPTSRIKTRQMTLPQLMELVGKQEREPDRCAAAVGQHPASRMHELTQRLWKQLFADNPVHLDLQQASAETQAALRADRLPTNQLPVLTSS
jgi:hypothetical protein